MRAEAPSLLAANVNTWLSLMPTDKRRMVRTLDGNVRALMSNGYRRMEYVDLSEAVLPILADMKLELISCELTDRRLYLKAVDPSINRDIPVKGARMGDGSNVIFDTCVPGIVISDSEVGYGQLSIETAVWTRACTNLCVFKEESMKKRHVGQRHELLTDDVMELLSDETQRLTDAALFERLGGQIINLSPSEWKHVANAHEPPRRAAA